MEPSSVFATLTPACPAARLAFSDVVAAVLNEKLNDRPLGMHFDPEPVLDAEVSRLRRLYERQPTIPGPPVGPDTSTSESEAESDANTRRTDMMTWTGCYEFGFKALSLKDRDAAHIGWTVGTGRPKGPRPRSSHSNAPDPSANATKIASLKAPDSVDFLLADWRLPFSKVIKMSSVHARFSFHPDNGLFFVAKVSRAAAARVILEGDPVSSNPAVFTKARMSVAIGDLRYTFEYTDFARTDEYRKLQTRHLQRLNASVITSHGYLLQTPVPSPVAFGGFALERPLGRGAEGRVWRAVNGRGDVVAVKVTQVNRRNLEAAQSEVRTWRTLTALAKAREGDKRFLLRLRGVLRISGPLSESHPLPFEDIALVTEPVADIILSDLSLPCLAAGMSIEVATIFLGILEAVNFLHSHGWIHGDIKPANIGLVGSPRRPILLDLGGALHYPGAKVPPTPGLGGTVHYLAPERELMPYDFGVDVWAVGVVGYELARGWHPWMFADNPWCPGPEYEALRPQWTEHYDAAMASLELAMKVPFPRPQDVVFVELLIKEMLKYSLDPTIQPRVTSAAAMAHPVWEVLKPEEAREHIDKKARV